MYSVLEDTSAHSIAHIQIVHTAHDRNLNYYLIHLFILLALAVHCISDSITPHFVPAMHIERYSNFMRTHEQLNEVGQQEQD